MKFHEKSLELNITHELLNLADSWYWFLSDIPLWRYWRPRYRLPFIPFRKSTAGGFHITSEGKSDNTGDKGGGYDVRIKNGSDNLLFIQYKKGIYTTKSPSIDSEFEKPPHKHFAFKINNKSTNQHFLLRELSKGIGSQKSNSVVYALPLIKNMADLESKAGKLLRNTKFISVNDIDLKAQANGVKFEKNKIHNFRVCETDLNRCEVNFFFFFFDGPDYTPNLISDVVGLGFEKNLNNYVRNIQSQIYEYRLSHEYIAEGIKRAYGQYLRYLLHYFEVNPENLGNDNLFYRYNNQFFTKREFNDYESKNHDVRIVKKVFESLQYFEEYITHPISFNNNKNFSLKIPEFNPSLFIRNNEEISFTVSSDFKKEDIDKVSYLSI